MLRLFFFRGLILTMAMLDLAWWRWADRSLKALPLARLWRLLLGLFVAFQLSFLALWVINPSALRNTHGLLPTSLLSAVYLWHLMVLPLSLALMLLSRAGYSVLSLAARAVGRLRGLPASPARSLEDDPDPLPNSMTRRQLLGAAVAVTPPLLLGVSVGKSMSQLADFRPRIRPFHLSFSDLPPELDGLTIAHISDSHVGRFTTPKMMNGIIDIANSLRADLAVFTGDLIDFSLEDLPDAIQCLRRLDARYGWAMCVGNHDLIEAPMAFENGMRAAGLPLLVNSAMSLPVRGSAVQFLGLSWFRGEDQMGQAVARLRPKLLPGAFPILLAHHPHAFDPAAAAGLPLTLSGHTHGGQIMLNEKLGPGPIMFRYWSGLYQQGRSSLVVSNGVGNWFPLRLHAPAEIIHLTLHANVA